MTDGPATPRFALPLLAPAQAQKEMFHNEALTLIDALIDPVLEGWGIDLPPANALPGQCWGVGPAPSGEWTGQPGALAVATAGGWRLIAVPDGFAARSAGDGGLVVKSPTGWSVVPVVPTPSGGSVVDQECRAALATLLGALAAVGIASS